MVKPALIPPPMSSVPRKPRRELLFCSTHLASALLLVLDAGVQASVHGHAGLCEGGSGSAGEQCGGQGEAIELDPLHGCL
jgi:hypothetical protein